MYIYLSRKYVCLASVALYCWRIIFHSINSWQYDAINTARAAQRETFSGNSRYADDRSIDGLSLWLVLSWTYFRTHDEDGRRQSYMQHSCNDALLSNIFDLNASIWILCFSHCYFHHPFFFVFFKCTCDLCFKWCSVKSVYLWILLVTHTIYMSSNATHDMHLHPSKIGNFLFRFPCSEGQRGRSYGIFK